MSNVSDFAKAATDFKDTILEEADKAVEKTMNTVLRFYFWWQKKYNGWD